MQSRCSQVTSMVSYLSSVCFPMKGVLNQLTWAPRLSQSKSTRVEGNIGQLVYISISLKMLECDIGHSKLFGLYKHQVSTRLPD